MDFDIATLRNGLIFFFLIASSLCLRAYAQAWVADRLGDPTPRSEGRLTANPLPHVDLLGTVVMPLIFIFYLQPALNSRGLTLFLGWAKPVPINPHHFKHPTRDAVITQFAGFGMGLVLLTLGAVAGGLLWRSGQQELMGICESLMGINATLMVFDLLPIPPLPGGGLLRHLGYISEETYYNIARWSGLVLIILINLKPFMIAFSIVRGLLLLPFYLLMQLFTL